MKLNKDYILKDPDYAGYELPYYDSAFINVNGDDMYGEIYVPGSNYDKPRACCLLFHGVPGTAVNDDLAQALRRMGMLVIRIFHRGAWGSRGKYSFSNCIEDALAVYDYAVNQVREKYAIDPDQIFLCGHSNGGNTTVNAARKLKGKLKGCVVFAPFDHYQCYLNHNEAVMEELCLEECRVLNIESGEALMKDSRDHASEWNFANAAEDLKSMNFFFAGGSEDAIAPASQMIDPLYHALTNQHTSASVVKKMYPAGHGFDSCRQRLIEDIGTWITEVSEQ